jgi:hypothetical protein
MTVRLRDASLMPAQANPDAKVPSIVLYDAAGVGRAFGAETEDDDVQVNADLEGWQKAEWCASRSTRACIVLTVFP